jgi:membrane protein YqaA with SNARE-associated domain
MTEPAHSTTETEAIVETDSLKQRLSKLVRSKYGTATLSLIAVIESMLPVPILTDPFLVAAVLMNRTRLVFLVLVTMISSVFGGVLAFLMLLYFRDFLFTLLSPENISTFNQLVAAGENTFLLTIVGAVTPVPYTIVAWTVALSSGSLIVFIIGSIVGRSIRYGIVGWCTYRFGPLAMQYARRSIAVTSVVIFILVGLYLWLKL